MSQHRPVLGLGTATFGRETSEDDSRRILDRAFDLGVRILDTAESYGGGNAREYRRTVLGVADVREKSGLMHSSELVLGKWIRDRAVRKDIFVAGKTGSAPNVRASLARSLDRLQLDFLDGYFLHSPPDAGILEETLGNLRQARVSGLIRETGLSNFPASLLETAHRMTPEISLFQGIYNLARPEAGGDLIPLCQRAGIAFWAYSPLGAGFLTGKYGSGGEVSVPGSRFDVIPGHRDIYFYEHCFAALRNLERLSAECGIPRAHLALAWVLRQPAVSVVLIGATSVRHVDHAIAAQSLVNDEDVWSRLAPAH